MLFRKIEAQIEDHLKSDSRAIMLIDGARQVGKTYIIRHVGQKLFENYIELNLVEDYVGARLFANAKTVEDFYLAVSMCQRFPAGCHSCTNHVYSHGQHPHGSYVPAGL